MVFESIVGFDYSFYCISPPGIGTIALSCVRQMASFWVFVSDWVTVVGPTCIYVCIRVFFIEKRLKPVSWFTSLSN